MAFDTFIILTQKEGQCLGITLTQGQQVFRTDIFSLFSPSQYVAKKERKKYHSPVKEPFPPKAGLSYHPLSQIEIKHTFTGLFSKNCALFHY